MIQTTAPRSWLAYAFALFYQDVKHKTASLKTTLFMLITLISKKKLEILLADDDEDSRDIFIEALNEIAPQIKVSIAKNGKELMDNLKAAKTAPDLIFLDLNMPIKNGQECLEEIRSNDMLAGLPVIIYSTSSNRQHIDETFKMGANYYLPKPDSFGDLKHLVNKVLALDSDSLFKPARNNFVLSIGNLK